MPKKNLVWVKALLCGWEIHANQAKLIVAFQRDKVNYSFETFFISHNVGEYIEILPRYFLKMDEDYYYFALPVESLFILEALPALKKGYVEILLPQFPSESDYYIKALRFLF
ncbi:MAG: hypothetical protein ABGX24_05775 [Aquificota bacterium]|jgi:hypothetical protein